MNDRDDRRVVLVGMSVREAVADEQMGQLADRVGGTCAYLQLGDPSLSHELTRLTEQGAGRITLVGVSLGTLAPAVSWLRRVTGHWWRHLPEPRPHLEVATTLVKGEADLDDAIAGSRPISGSEAGLTSVAWQDVPRHRHQLLLCRGPRCTVMGSDKTAEAFVLAAMRAGLEDDDVLITHTGCQFPCNNAPVVSVQPDDVWYGGVDPAAAELIVREHLVGDHPCESHRLPRQRSGPRTEDPPIDR
jgi:(2Fe-2S) ferredoxin